MIRIFDNFIMLWTAVIKGVDAEFKERLSSCNASLDIVTDFLRN